MQSVDTRGYDLDEAYRYCLGIAQWHYENFPVASHALPAELRGPVAAIYAFARTADDFADEGDHPPEIRLARLNEYRERIGRLAHGDTPQDPIFIALADVRRRFSLPLEPLNDLLDAFTIDVVKQRFASFDEVLAYCRCSANPIGRMMLHLYHEADARNIGNSDLLCSAFQLVNFLQDLEQDYRGNHRIYLPLDEMALHGVTEEHFRDRCTDDSMRALVAHQVARIRRMLIAGSPLAWRLSGRAGFELRMIVFGVVRILDKIAAQQRNLFARPHLGKRDWLWIALRASTARGI